MSRVLLSMLVLVAVGSAPAWQAQAVTGAGSTPRAAAGAEVTAPQPHGPRSGEPRPGQRQPGQPRFGWPLPGTPEVLRAFEAPVHRFAAGHRGVDLAAAAGTPVLAAGTGTVVFAGPVAGRTVVSIDHPGGLRTTYEPVEPLVRAGDLVTTGERIGTVQAGHPACAPEVCLHWGVRRGDEYLDPLHLLGLGAVRLLPWRDAPDARRFPSAGGR